MYIKEKTCKLEILNFCYIIQFLAYSLSKKTEKNDEKNNCQSLVNIHCRIKESCYATIVAICFMSNN